MLETQYSVEYCLFTLVIVLLTGEPRLTATAWHHKRESYCILLAQEKIKIQKFEVRFLLNVYHFCTIVNLKNHKSTTISQEPSVLSSRSPKFFSTRPVCVSGF